MYALPTGVKYPPTQPFQAPNNHKKLEIEGCVACVWIGHCDTSRGEVGGASLPYYCEWSIVMLHGRGDGDV